MLHPTFKDALVRATLAPNRALPESIQSLVLGSFQQESQNLLDASNRDPNHREYLKQIIVTNTRKVLIQNASETSGELSSEGITVQAVFRTNILPFANFNGPREFQQDKFLGSFLHSHPVDLPPSPLDIMQILLNDQNPSAGTAVFVITPLDRYVIFRGVNTPMLEKNDGLKKVEILNQALMRRFQKNLKPSMTLSENIDLNKRIQMALLRDLSREYDLKVFIGFNESSQVQRRRFDQ